MAILTQNYVLNVVPGQSVPLVVHCSQGDVGAQLKFALYAVSEPFNPVGAVISVHGIRRDGTGFGPNVCTYTGNVVTVTLTEEMTAVAGYAIAELVITQNDGTVSTSNFALSVERAAFPAGPIVSNSVDVYQQILTYVQELGLAVKNMVSSPLVASKAARMTDKTHVYVYTGSESGYTAGHWYYWDGSMWADGGVYNAVAFETDKSLSVSDMAADAKVTGDHIRALSTDVTTIRDELDRTKQDLAIEIDHVELEIEDARIGTASGTKHNSLQQKLTADYVELDEKIMCVDTDLRNTIRNIKPGLSDEAKTALLNCFQHVAWIDEHGQDYYDALEEALNAETQYISLNKSSMSIIIGSTEQLTATTVPAGGTVMWSSSNTAIATVSQTGLVTAIANGNATITATFGTATARCSVLVSAAALTSISAKYTQSGTVYDSDALDTLKKDLVVTANWSDGTHTTVSAADYTLSGTLTEGTSTITVTYGGKTATFNVTVAGNPAYITAVFTQPSTTIYTDDSLDTLKQYLTVKYFATKESTGTVIASDDYTLSGVLTEGTSTITVTYEGLRTNVSVIGVVDFYNIWNWSLSNGDFEKLVASTDRNKNSTTGVTIRQDSTVQYRRHYPTTRGKLPYTIYNTETLSEYYPIPIPTGANKIKISATPSTQFTFMNVVKYNSETNKYEYYEGAADIGGWTQGINEKTITASDNLFLFFNTKYDSAGTSYPTEPSDVTVEFEEV